MKFRIEGMTCGHCVSTLSRAIQAIDPAAKVNAQLGERMLAVSSGVAVDDVQRAIEAAGYSATVVDRLSWIHVPPEDTDPLAGKPGADPEWDWRCRSVGRHGLGASGCGAVSCSKGRKSGRLQTGGNAVRLPRKGVVDFGVDDDVAAASACECGRHGCG